MKLTKAIAPALAVLMIAGFAPSASAAEHSAENETVENPEDGTEIVITIFKPAAAAKGRVPVILHSHGWGGTRVAEIGGVVERFLDAGFGVVSIDQRGHGDSGGEANVQDPTKETEDIKAVIDRVASLDWVALDRPGDPVLGAIGGSYGGGYQTMTALDEIADEGRTRFDAIAPEITWFDLPESLAPQGVVRSAWVVALYAAGAQMLPQYVHESFAWGAATGQWPDGTLYGQSNSSVPDLDSEFHEHSPVAFVEDGIRLDVPVLLRQGTSDNLFNLNQGLKIFDQAVTKRAQKRSYFVSFNGGHALPNALPPGAPLDAQLGAGVDACSPDGDFTQLSIDFFKRALAGKNTRGLLPQRYNLTALDGETCLRYASLDKSEVLDVGLPGAGGAVSTAGAGAPIHIPVTTGPLTVAGVPTLKGTVTALGLDARAFLGLAVGTTPADAKVVQNNLMPLHRVLPVTDDKFDIELPGVTVEVAEGQTLYLTITSNSDMYGLHGSRTPGAMVLGGLELTLPGARSKGK